MFGLGFTEILLILGVALLVFGPEKLPEIARTLGKTMGELRRSLDEVKFDLSNIQYEPPKTPDKTGIPISQIPTPAAVTDPTTAPPQESPVDSAATDESKQ